MFEHPYRSSAYSNSEFGFTNDIGNIIYHMIVVVFNYEQLSRIFLYVTSLIQPKLNFIGQNMPIRSNHRSNRPTTIERDVISTT